MYVTSVDAKVIFMRARNSGVDAALIVEVDAADVHAGAHELGRNRLARILLDQ
jgi:hypothetical protein